MNIETRINEESAARREEVEGLGFFDAGLWLGEPSGFPFAEPLDPLSVPGVLSAYGMTQALLSHWDGSVVSAQDGNRSLIEAESGLPDTVFTVWTGLPLFPEEREPLPGLGEPHPRMRGVRLFPKAHKYPLAKWMTGSLCAWMTERRLPLFIQHVETDWPALYTLAGEFPDLQIVVESQWQKVIYHTRPLFNLMKDRRNVLLETSNLVSGDIFAWAVKEVGAEQLIFGSFAPVSDPLVPMGMILDSDVSDEEKRLAAGGNLRRILGMSGAAEDTRAGVARAPGGAAKGEGG